MLYAELDRLRMNICHDCNMKLVAGSVSVPALTSPSRYLDASIAPKAAAPFWRRMFRVQRRRLSPPRIDDTASGSACNPAIPSSIPDISLSAFDTPVMNSSSQQTSDSPPTKYEPPEFLVVYNPEVKRTLDLRLAHVFTHEHSAFCILTDNE